MWHVAQDIEIVLQLSRLNVIQTMLRLIPEALGRTILVSEFRTSDYVGMIFYGRKLVAQASRRVTFQPRQLKSRVFINIQSTFMRSLPLIFMAWYLHDVHAYLEPAAMSQ